MSLPSAAIIAIAVSAGAAVLITLGVVLFWLLRRSRQKCYNEKGGRHLTNRIGGNISLNQLENRTVNASGRGFLKLFGPGKFRHSVSPTEINGDSDASRNGSGQHMAQRGHHRWNVISDSTAVYHPDVEPTQDSQSRDDGCRIEVPSPFPQSMASENDETEPSTGVLQRQGFHLPGNPKGKRYLVRSRRASNLRCFSDSVQSIKRAETCDSRTDSKAIATHDRRGRLRSLSFQSHSSGSASKREGSLSPDAIYDACSRLGVSPGQISDMAKRKRVRSAVEPNILKTGNFAISQIGNRRTFERRFPSTIESPGRNSEKHRRVDNEGVGLQRAHRSFHSSLYLPSRPDIKSGGRTDSLRVADGSSSLEREKSSSMSLSLHDNWHTPIKGGDSCTDRVWLVDEQGEAGVSTSTSDLAYSKRIQSLRARGPRQLRRSHGEKDSRVLRELAGGSNKQSRPTSSNSMADDESLKKRSSDDRISKYGRIRASQSLKHKRSSTNRIYLHVSRPNSVAASAILEDEILDISTPRNSPVSQSAGVMQLDFAGPFPRGQRGSSVPPSDPDFNFDNSVQYHTDDSCANTESDPSVLWSLIGEIQSDPSFTGGYPLQASPPPCSEDGEAEDALNIFPDQSGAKPDLKSNHNSNPSTKHPRQLPTPSRSSAESYEIKPIPPLRPRNSATSSFIVPAAETTAHHSSSANSSVYRLAEPVSRRSRSSKEPQNPRSSHQSTSRGQITDPSQSKRSSPHETSGSRAPSPLAVLFNSPFIKQSASRFSKLQGPPPGPPPPPPSEILLAPPGPTQGQSRMTSLMMQLRRQNSDSSAYDSSYFKLPHEQLGSQRTSYEVNSSANGSSATPKTSSEISHGRERAQQAERTRSFRSSSGQMSHQNGNSSANDPFVESSRLRSRDPGPRHARLADPSYSLLPSYGSNARQFVANHNRAVVGEAIGHAVELDKASQAIIPARRDGGYRPPSPVLRSMSDDSEHDLSPVGRSIMAETRREHYESKHGQNYHQQKSSSSLPRQKPVLQFQQHFPSMPPSPAPTLHSERRRRHQNSSIGSASPADTDRTRTPDANKSRVSIGAGGSNRTSGRMSRRESQRSRMDALKERVSSMEIANRTKNATLAETFQE